MPINIGKIVDKADDLAASIKAARDVGSQKGGRISPQEWAKIVVDAAELCAAIVTAAPGVLAHLHQK